MPQDNRGPIAKPYITSKDRAQLSPNNRPKAKGTVEMFHTSIALERQPLIAGVESKDE